MRFTGTTSLAALRDVEVFARVNDALAIVTACRVSAGALLGELSNAPTASSVAALQSALRAQYAAADWLAVVKPINDTLRIAQRDALVAYILQGFKSKPPAPPYDGVDTSDKLFEFFLMDVENQPAVLTSRIRLALSTVKLFIERVQRGIETQTAPGDIDARQWTWMKRYRVWQANREVFLWPENWLYPELRDDQTEMFKKTLSALLQSDITGDAATAAYLDYLSSLELIAKLEPCGIYYVPASDGSSGGGASDEIAYVIARTSGAHRKHYFRQMQGGAWTPWEEVKIDCEDMPLTPILWNNRLMLFWLRVQRVQKPQPAVGQPSNGPSGQGADLGLEDGRYQLLHQQHRQRCVRHHHQGSAVLERVLQRQMAGHENLGCRRSGDTEHPQCHGPGPRFRTRPQPHPHRRPTLSGKRAAGCPGSRHPAAPATGRGRRSRSHKAS